MNIVAERLNRGLSLQEAANQIGVSRGTLRRAEEGERPTPKLAKKVADFYDARPTDIWPVEEPNGVAA